MLILLTLQTVEFEKLPIDETIELSSSFETDRQISDMMENSDLVFTVNRITRRLSILGWASDRYDLDVGEVLKGDLGMETAYIYVFQDGWHSMRFSSVQPGAEVVVSALRDESGTVMEGFNTMEDDWVISGVYILNPDGVPVSEPFKLVQ